MKEDNTTPVSPQGEREPDPFETSEERNWPEDYADENGNYVNRCFYCEKFFRGHKYRRICKLCDAGSIEDKVHGFKDNKSNPAMNDNQQPSESAQNPKDKCGFCGWPREAHHRGYCYHYSDESEDYFYNDKKFVESASDTGSLSEEAFKEFLTRINQFDSVKFSYSINELKSSFRAGAEYEHRHMAAKQAEWLEKDDDYQQLKKENQAYAIAQEGNLAKLDELNAKQAELIAERDKAKQALQECIKSYEKQLYAYRAENEQLKADIKEMQDAEDGIISMNVRVDLENKKLKENYSGLRKAYEDLSSENIDECDKVRALQSENARLREALEAARVTLKAFLPESWATIAAVEAALTTTPKP